MSGKKLVAGCCAAVFGLAIATESALAILARVPPTILVVPARYRTIQLAFEIASIRPVGLVSYRADTGTDDLLLHVWNGREWRPISLQDYTSGGFLLGEPERLIVVGDDALLPKAMAATPTWCPVLDRLRSLDTAAQINEIGALLRFKPREWEWIADRHHLPLTDLNAERRRHGRYGSGDAKDRPEPQLTEIEPASAVLPPDTIQLEETKASQPVAPAPATPAPAAPLPAVPPAKLIPLPAERAPAPAESKPAAEGRAIPVPESAPAVRAVPVTESILPPVLAAPEAAVPAPAAAPVPAAATPAPEPAAPAPAPLPQDK